MNEEAQAVRVWFVNRGKPVLQEVSKKDELLQRGFLLLPKKYLNEQDQPIRNYFPELDTAVNKDAVLISQEEAAEELLKTTVV